MKVVGGKPRGDVSQVPAVQGNIEEETLAIRRGGISNGNEIRENITVIKRKPGHGIYIHRHLINKELLKECCLKIDGKKAVGIDGVTNEEYSSHLEENLELLEEQIKNKSYKPKPARKVEIPKEDGKTRPLSIYCYEDKLVQDALRRILEAVFEPYFYNEMMGFRPGRGCHQELRLYANYNKRLACSIVEIIVGNLVEFIQSRRWIL